QGTEPERVSPPGVTRSKPITTARGMPGNRQTCGRSYPLVAAPPGRKSGHARFTTGSPRSREGSKVRGSAATPASRAPSDISRRTGETKGRRPAPEKDPTTGQAERWLIRDQLSEIRDQ